MTGTARPGQGVPREVESEGRRCRNLGFDEQEPEVRASAWGHPARDGDAHPKWPAKIKPNEKRLLSPSHGARAASQIRFPHKLACTILSDLQPKHPLAFP